ncbi:MAG: HdeD family acid-resistance protein [Candidatus Merdivicinus sp.]|jgi:uncharacterized membrane protein HdeD (DUF308 family)
MKKTGFYYGILPILYIVLGIILIIWPTMSSSIFCWIVGIGALLYGLFHLFSFWQASREGFSFRIELILGIIFAALGIFCLISPRTILSILPFFLGVILLIDGASKIPRAMEMKELGFSRWWIELLFAVVTAILGLILVLNPFSLVRFSVIFFGVSLLVSGITDLVMTTWSGRYR